LYTRIQTLNKVLPLKPFLKWAGGKRQLLSEIRQYVPSDFNVFYEPFVGAGAVLFDLQPNRAVINDINTELVNAYRVIKDNVDELIGTLSGHKNDEEYYYAIRNIDRSPEYKSWSNVERTSRLIFINKTCFNGLFRTNSRGQWNVPFGRYTNPRVLNEEGLKAISRYMNENNITMLNTDFEDALTTAGKRDFVYLDPPYDPISVTSSFTSYHMGGFDRDEQKRLKETVDDLTRRGCLVMLSNSNTEYVRELYKEYNVVTTTATRAINSNASKRGRVEEVLVLNYDPRG
jgi:DNA adenine methylase